MALEPIQSHFPIPIIGVIDPVLEELSTSRHIGVLGTRATIASKLHYHKIQQLLPHAQITALPSPLLVSLVEEGWSDHPITFSAIQEYIKPLLEANIDTLILACTHFPLIQDLIQKAAGPSIRVLNPAIACAKATREILSSLNLLSEENIRIDPLFYVTDDPNRFKKLGPQFLGRPIKSVEQVRLY
jgi:glutamate racemase